MSKADEMFKKLGYIEHFKFKDSETYRTDSSHCLGKSIIFQDYDKRLLLPQVINIQELQTINEKVKELRVDIKIREER